ncbi:MAG: response regulator [Candidatus Omnitrophota bacterium]
MEKRKILMVDDEVDFADMIRMRLENTGKYEVAVLADTRDILSRVHKFRPDLILLDLLIPDIGGMEVCEMLDRDPQGIGIPIIILSALDKDTDKKKAYKLGVVDYLVKPVDPDRLLASVEKAIESKTRGE